MSLRRWRFYRAALAAGVLLGVLALVLPAFPKKAKPQACAGGRFLVQGEPLVGEAADGPGAVLLASGEIAIQDLCPAVRVRSRVTPKGTRVKAGWKACPPLTGRVQLRGMISPTCQTLTARLTAKKSKLHRSFTARASTCGDQVVDRANGEECDSGVGCGPSLTCTDDCGCLRAVTPTTTPPATPTTLGATTTTVVVTGTTAPGSSTTTVTSTSSGPSTTSGPTTTTIPTGPPPDPATVAPVLDSSVITGFADATAFLYGGPTPIQYGVAPGTIVPRRAAVLRGSVRTRDGQPIPAVDVRVLDHPELGFTRTRIDGMFDLAVNGGGTLTVDYTKAGFLPAQRQLPAPWGDFAMVPDVVLVPADAAMTPIDLGAGGMQVARGSISTDADGSRRATLLVPPGTTATMVLPDGSTRPLASLHVRATEYTVGDSGPAAMPGQLPPTTAYTYAVEYSVDEALAAGAVRVEFNQPVIHYLENFLHFPVGSQVPNGTYDRQRATWVASDNGRVIAVVGITAGRADIDTDGDGQPDAGPGLGITDAERQHLAELYTPAQTLWRVPMSHFTPADHNWPYGPPPDGSPPPPPPPPRKPDDKPCDRHASVIGCQNRTLGEDVGLAGTRFGLHYSSDRVYGRVAARRLVVPLSDATIPAPLLHIEFVVALLGREFRQTFPAAPNQTATFDWDGLDAFGRPVQGTQLATVRIGYAYQAVLQDPGQRAASFGALSGFPVEGDPARQQITIFRERKMPVGAWDARGVGLGGWTIGVHHTLDVAARTVYLGDGRRRSAVELGTIETIAGGGESIIADAPIPATQAFLLSPTKAAPAPDGGYYIAESGAGRVHHVTPDGFVVPIAGGGPEHKDEVPGTQSQLGFLNDVTVGPDGSVYISEFFDCRVRRVTPDGIIHTVIGKGRRPFPSAGCGHSGDGGPATAAEVDTPQGVVVAPDGTLFVVENNSSTVRRIGPDGVVTSITALFTGQSDGDGGPASMAHLFGPSALAPGTDGSLYIGDGSYRVRRIGPDGIIRTIAGTGVPGSTGDGGPATAATIGFGSQPLALAVSPGGVVYIGDRSRVRAVGLDGIIRTVAGTADPGFSGDGGPPGLATLQTVTGIAIAPDGALIITDRDNSRVRRVGPAFQVGSVSLGAGAIGVPDDGEVWLFDQQGRHLATVDAFTGATRWQFTYDGAGRLASVTDGDGNTTTVEHDGAGAAKAIVAPGGQRTPLTVNASGFLATVTDPVGGVTQLDYAAGGLLTDLTDPKAHHHHFVYAADGLLEQDQDGAGGVLTLAGTDTPSGRTVSLTTALGRASTFATELLPSGKTRYHNVDPNGAETTVDVGESDDTETATYPDGRTVAVERTGDPRFGFTLPMVSHLVYATPGGRTATVTSARTATLLDPGDPFTLQTLTSTLVRNGHPATATYTAATRTLTRTSAEGRQRITLLDARGRVASVTLAPGVDPVVATRDPKGRITTLAQGPQSSQYAYDAKGRLMSRTDALGGVIQYGYDDAGRATSFITAGARAYGFGYDANGNATSVTMPSGAVHTLSYTPIDLPGSYTPPANAPYTRTYNVDTAFTALGLPGGRTVTHAYDAGGRPQSVTSVEAAVTFTYGAGDHTDRVADITRTPVGGGGAQQLTFAYDGDLVTKVEFAGVATGRFDVTHDNEFLPVSVMLTSGADTVSTALTWDGDRLLTGAGPFTITRTGPGGAPTRVDDGTFRLDVGYDSLARADDRSVTIAGSAVYALTLDHDAAGRVTHRHETLAGVSHDFTYAYDADGQLLEVDDGGVAAERYTYDVNGNRTSRRLGAAAAVIATYDAQDRILTDGATSYAVDADGMLAARGTTAFTFGARRELLGATLPGQVVSFSYDGIDRRVGRTDASGTTQYLYSGVTGALELTASRDAAGALTVYRYDPAGYLVALERGATRYYVATDQVGSPRAVFDAAGSVVERITYDAFGSILADTNSAFGLAIGFAGGLRDPTTGLVHFGARDYDPQAGRWTTRDPALYRGRQANLYVYIDNDPVGRRIRPGSGASAPVHISASAPAASTATQTRDGRSAPRRALASGNRWSCPATRRRARSGTPVHRASVSPTTCSTPWAR